MLPKRVFLIAPYSTDSEFDGSGTSLQSSIRADGILSSSEETNEDDSSLRWMADPRQPSDDIDDAIPDPPPMPRRSISDEVKIRSVSDEIQSRSFQNSPSGSRSLCTSIDIKPEPPSLTSILRPSSFDLGRIASDRRHHATSVDAKRKRNCRRGRASDRLSQSDRTEFSRSRSLSPGP